MRQAKHTKETPEDGRVLIAMGGAVDTSATRDAIAAALEADGAQNIEVLFSPLLKGSNVVRGITNHVIFTYQRP